MAETTVMDEESDDETETSPVASKQTAKPARRSSMAKTPTSSASSFNEFGSSRKRTSSSTSSGLPVSKLTVKPTKEVHRFNFIENRLDAHKRPPNHPDFDPNTVFIDPADFAKLSPFEKQYWTIKKDHYETILFFKKGKFYEVYERDAYIANKEFQWKITERVNMSMAGVPESKMTDWAARFLALGFKVARADERESALAMQMRQRKEAKSGKAPKKAAKIIERKLTTIYTQGTLMGDFVQGDMSSYIMAVKEDASTHTYAVVFADTATAEFNLCHFKDDAARTQFETLIIQVMPKELVLCRTSLSKESLKALKATVPNAVINWLDEGDQFWDEEKTANCIDSKGYFKARTQDISNGWPCVLDEARQDTPMLVAVFGGLLSYFTTLMIDEQLLPQATFVKYDPMHHGSTLVLDGQTLQNLEVLSNNYDHTTHGTLLELLCHTTSAFGKRLFRRWLCHPLRHAQDIEQRQQAVEAFEAEPAVTDELLNLLKEVPDLERLLARVHIGACKLADFLDLLSAFELVRDAVKRWNQDGIVARLAAQRLQQLLSTKFPNMDEALDEITSSFNRKQAETQGFMEPSKGAIEEYDEACTTEAKLTKVLSRHLEDCKSLLHVKKHKVQFWHPSSGKERYQIQVPNDLDKHVPSDWKLMSSTKTLRRYHSPTVAKHVQALLEAEETKNQIKRDFFKMMLVKTDSHSAVFGAAFGILAELDCLLSLYKSKQALGEPCCKPVFLTDEPRLELTDMRHPCMLQSGAVQDYIPNDTNLGGDQERIILLTGPNMGGKSTLLRQTCTAVIMAQMGCWVPAERCALTPVDRIFTRIGANDNIIAGRSTFMVELKETATILNQATADSLVILDELGRGTSTFDGYAIAHAVLHHLAATTGCRSMFATHYHALCDEFAQHDIIANWHMGCVVDESSGNRDVTFLYKLTPGVCSKSYGMNVAHMAGVPAGIIRLAEAKAAEFEAGSQFSSLQVKHLTQARTLATFRRLLNLHTSTKPDSLSWLLKDK
eukprot:TRINITY_DN11332_c0_g2_i4.p1 TRINITY_DN11332_c0_g2~~TRINITY_DN11332_c0_g2_i4.p1  ORF type:complete len:1069 (+),score=317.75 TRINITY_DN11332_c0_g2_i4:188-3208(+)